MHDGHPRYASNFRTGKVLPYRSMSQTIGQIQEEQETKLRPFIERSDSKGNEFAHA